MVISKMFRPQTNCVAAPLGMCMKKRSSVRENSRSRFWKSRSFNTDLLRIVNIKNYEKNKVMLEIYMYECIILSI